MICHHGIEHKQCGSCYSLSDDAIKYNITHHGIGVIKFTQEELRQHDKQIQQDARYSALSEAAELCIKNKVAMKFDRGMTWNNVAQLCHDELIELRDKKES